MKNNCSQLKTEILSWAWVTSAIWSFTVRVLFHARAGITCLESACGTQNEHIWTLDFEVQLWRKSAQSRQWSQLLDALQTIASTLNLPERDDVLDSKSSRTCALQKRGQRTHRVVWSVLDWNKRALIQGKATDDRSFSTLKSIREKSVATRRSHSLDTGTVGTMPGYLLVCETRRVE